MMSKNIIITLLATLLLGTNAWQLYGRIDQGVTMSYMDGELYELRNTQNELEKLLLQFIQGMPATKMEALLETTFPDATRFKKENHVHSGFLSFKLNKNGEHIESIGYEPGT